MCLLVGVARIQEALGNLGLSAKYYKTVLTEDSTHVEVGRGLAPCRVSVSAFLSPTNRLAEKKCENNCPCLQAIACIGMNHFYSDQPELSLRFYRRLLQVEAVP